MIYNSKKIGLFYYWNYITIFQAFLNWDRKYAYQVMLQNLRFMKERMKKLQKSRILVGRKTEGKSVNFEQIESLNKSYDTFFSTWMKRIFYVYRERS